MEAHRYGQHGYDTTRGVPQTGPYWDASDEYESGNNVYTITVHVLPKSPSQFLATALNRSHEETPPRSFSFHDLQSFPKQIIEIKAKHFDVHLRCKHLVDRKNTSRICDQGCYVLDKGGKPGPTRWHCATKFCEGHTYFGEVSKNEHGFACFGKKGSRMACISG
jgi:hypothetical protein